MATADRQLVLLGGSNIYNIPDVIRLFPISKNVSCLVKEMPATMVIAKSSTKSITMVLFPRNVVLQNAPPLAR